MVDVLHISELGRAELFRVCWAPNQTISNLSPIGYHIYDIYNFTQDCKPLELTAKDKKDINSWFESKKENIPDNEYKGMFKGKNLIIIQVESLENFVIGQKINGQEITPNLNKLLGNSLYFPDYYEQVYNGTSSDADLMTNTSIYPVRRGSTFFRYPGNKYNSLPKLMQGIGYSTLAVHPDNASYWNWMPALKSIGFQRCIDASYFDQSETIGMGISDGSYLRQVEPLAEKQKQPFYMFLVTLTSHAPFNLPQQYRELKLDPALDKTKLGGYFQSMHYTDKQLGIFIDKLQKSGVLNNTAIALYGDHCGIHKFYQQEVNQIQPSQSWWLDNHHHIPLIIYQKNLKGKTVSTIGGEIDLMPTISYLMGIDESKYADTTMGRNLLKTNKNFAVLADGKYVGTAASSKEKNSSIQGLEIANKIIESNYFKNK
jgi:lipoteichoic acid synthase